VADEGCREVRIAIAGAGIAGTYLSRLLAKRGIETDLYDGRDQGTPCRYRSCGWGAPSGIGHYLAAVDLDLEGYLMDSMSSMEFDGLIASTPLCTINKPRLLRDLAAGLALHHHPLDRHDPGDYDIIVDATGICRAFLSPCRSDLVLPTLQHRMKVEPVGDAPLIAGVYGNRIPGLGYLWIFPLGNGEYHIGVGGIRLDQHERILEQYYEANAHRYTFTPVCSCRGNVRVASPYYSQPFSLPQGGMDGTSPRIIGVGESIGTVAPFTGEGIIYSLECARILAACWPDQDRYKRTVLAQFAWMRRERETLEYLLLEGKETGPRLKDRWRFYLNARRSGIRLPLAEAFRRMGSLSRWVENP